MQLILNLRKAATTQVKAHFENRKGKRVYVKTHSRVTTGPGKAVAPAHKEEKPSAGTSPAKAPIKKKPSTAGKPIRTKEERIAEEKAANKKAMMIASKKKLSENDVKYLMDHNKGLIIQEANKLANRYKRPDLAGDVIQDMHLAMWHTYVRGQGKGNVNWFTHLMTRGRDYAKRELQKYSKITRFGDAERDARRYAQIKAFSAAYEAENGAPPSDEMIAEAINSTPDRVRQIMVNEHEADSMDTSRDVTDRGSDKPVNLHESIASEDEDPEQRYERMNFREVFEDRLWKLPRKKYEDYFQPFMDFVIDKVPLKTLSEQYQRPVSTLHRKIEEMKDLLRNDPVLQEFKARMLTTLTLAKSVGLKPEMVGIDIFTFRLYRFLGW